ncbi:uncharacterized protein si:dkey-163f14.6 isoform X2 [Siniperca chuatsi]|uniref:uncharacterized protein si:dkey-163f14.6 isoform X2 n=1 Tax=Siniperca chuatsi TaxID=119488 RepID=UPI001CE1EB7B|nr:uncharacterized protein si:dkey-163f14.6 isoform X2 [Siniperca chuatsi]
MGAQMRLLAALVALLCIYAPVCGAEGCSGFRHLENGQTFFRYGGLLVIFRCRPGYKLHGYKTNSCVSGHWSRDTPVCVGSGCSNPGPLTHGTSSMNEDGSLAVFSCNTGFRLHGPSMLYCKGHTWNSTKPVCKESDMMSSVSGVNMQKPNVHLNLQAAVVLKTQQQSHYDTLANTASKEANLKFGLLSHTPSQMSNSERIKVSNPKLHLPQHIQFPSFKVRDGVQTTRLEAQLQEASKSQEAGTGTGRHGSEVKVSREGAEKVDKVTQMFASKSYLSTTVSSTLSLVAGTERTSSLPSFSTAHTPAITAVTNTAVTPPTVMFVPTSPLHHKKSALPVLCSEKELKSGESVTSQDDVTPSEVETGSAQTADEDQQVETGFHSSSTSSPASSHSLSPPFPSFSTSTSLSLSSTQPNMKTQLPNVTLPSNTTTTTEPRSHWTEYHNLTTNATTKPPLLSLSLSRRPVCPYPRVPTHGTFYFRNVENPRPGEYRHYIQYACYPGYTLAHGDIHSYCQQGGTWSGITPVCLELTPCSVNNGGCSQLCSHSQHYNQSSNQTQTRTKCHCRPGFTLLDDVRTCRDLDECVEGQHQCQQRCINTFGSFKCSCDDGYQPAHDQTSCTDVDECLLPAAVTGCVFGCVNTPGSFHCQCPAGYSLQSADSYCQDIDECAVNQGLGPCMEQCHNSPGSYRCSCTYGHILAGNGHSCIAECPPGYRKQPTTTPENSTAQALREECVDINECQEERCEWQCVNLPGSHRCICPRGYTLQRDGRRCKDINECNRKNGGCSHLCVNHKGGYKCACPASHRLSPYSWKKCLPRTTANTAG